jgi:hypothetical protein
MKKERRTFAKKRSPERWSFSPGISRGRRRIEEEEERERERDDKNKQTFLKQTDVTCKHIYTQFL